MLQTHARLQFTIWGVKHMKMWQIFDKIRIVGMCIKGTHTGVIGCHPDGTRNIYACKEKLWVAIEWSGLEWWLVVWPITLIIRIPSDGYRTVSISSSSLVLLLLGHKRNNLEDLPTGGSKFETFKPHIHHTVISFHFYLVLRIVIFSHFYATLFP
jgi:hypothetical protein